MLNLTHPFALYAREVKRFQKIWMDTIFSPIMSMVLYLSVFGIVAGNRTIDGTSYLAFIYAGLLSMTMVNSSFSNPAFALIIAKNVGTIADLQLVPIRAWKVGMAYAAAALTRSLVTLLIALLATVWFIPGLTLPHPFILLAGLVLTGMEFGMLGVVFGMWAKNFEALTFITTFIMQPMIFLAGVFYPISQLPAPWNAVSAWNPMHHNINLLRYGATGYQDGSPLISLGVILAISAVLFSIMHIVTQKSLKQH